MGSTTAATGSRCAAAISPRRSSTACACRSPAGMASCARKPTTSIRSPCCAGRRRSSRVRTAPAASLNLVSKRPQAAAAREVSVRLGNYNHRELRIDTTGPLNADKSLLYRLVAVGKDADTQIQYADTKRALLAPSLTWRGARGSLTGYGEYQYERSKNTNAFLGLEGTLNPAPHGFIPTRCLHWRARLGSLRRHAPARRLRGESHSLTSNWRLRHSLRHDRVDGLMKSMYASWWDGFVDADGAIDPEGTYLGRMWYVSDDSSRVTATEGAARRPSAHRPHRAPPAVRRRRAPSRREPDRSPRASARRSTCIRRSTAASRSPRPTAARRPTPRSAGSGSSRRTR